MTTPAQPDRTELQEQLRLNGFTVLDPYNPDELRYLTDSSIDAITKLITISQIELLEKLPRYSYASPENLDKEGVPGHFIDAEINRLKELL